MNDLDNDIERIKVYCNIGRFIVDFEQLVWELRFKMSGLIQMSGLQNFRLSEAIFSDKYYTAYPLAETYHRIICEAYRFEESTEEITDILKATKDFKKKFQTLADFRNNLVHSRHDLNNDEDNNIIGYSASKLKPNLGEVGYKDVIKGIDEVITKITEVNDLNLELRHLFGKTIKHLDETGWFEKWNNNYQK